MKTRIRIFYVIVIFAVLVNSCHAIKYEGTTPTSSHDNLTAAALSAMPSATVTASSVPDFDFSCWPVKPLEKGNGIRGGILYANFSREPGKRYANGFYAWGLNSFQSVPVKLAPHQLKFEDEDFQSPDGKLVALISENSLLIISQNGTRAFPLPLENLKIRTYLPDGQILLDLQSHLIDYYQTGKGFTDTYYIFDPTTGEAIKHSVFLPNFVPGEDLWTLQYSPNMKYLLYRSSPGENNVEFTLFDLQKNEVVWVGPPRASNLINIGVPAWRPDSGALTAIYKDETGYFNYYSISLDGKVSAINNFNGAELTGVTRSNVWWNLDLAEFANWSPNGQYLASTGIQRGVIKGQPSLFIWNDQEKMLYKPCVPKEGDRISTQYYAIWSYDSSYVWLSVTLLQTSTPVEVVPGYLSPAYVSKRYILDLVDRIIYEMPDDNNKDYFVTYKGGFNAFSSWVNWQIP